MSSFNEFYRYLLQQGYVVTRTGAGSCIMMTGPNGKKISFSQSWRQGNEQRHSEKNFKTGRDKTVQESENGKENLLFGCLRK